MMCNKKTCTCFPFNRSFCKSWVPDVVASPKQKPVFEKIWNERAHVCWITGDRLPEPAKADYFFHVLPKGAYPGYKTNEENLILTRSDYHHDWHSKGRSELLEKDSRWQKVFDLYDELKIQYQCHKH